MPQDSAQENKPSVVYSPLRINWRNVVLGAVIGLLIVATGVLAFSYYDPDASPVPKVEIRKGTPSAKTATPSSQASPSSTTTTSSAETE